MNGLVFRELNKLTDRDIILRITASSGFFEPGEVDLALEYFDACAQEESNSEHTFLMADLNGSTVGYSNYGKASYSGLSWYLHWIAVDEAYRGKGLGKLILAETERIIQQSGGRKVFIETSSKPEYIATQKFYESTGYIVEARLKDFYLIGDDQLIFSKILES